MVCIQLSMWPDLFPAKGGVMNHKQRYITGAILGMAILLSSCSYLEQTKAPDNKVITAEVQAKLFADSTLKHHDIGVVTEDGVVTLTGEVSTELEKAAVERIAMQTSGVKKVINQLTTGAVATAAPKPAAAPELAPAVTPASAPARAAKPATRAPKHSASAPAEPEMVPAPVEAGRPVAENAPQAPPPPSAPEAVTVTIPEGTSIMVRMIDTIDSAMNKPGEEFAASVYAPVVIDDHIVIRKGADARVRLINSKTAGKMTGKSELEVELVGLAIGSQTFAVESTGISKAGASRTTRTAQTVGGGAALGGLIGAIAGKGKGAAIGAAIGAGAGTAVQVITKGEQVKIPSETQLEFALKAPISVTL
jgi:hypothetical protein